MIDLEIAFAIIPGLILFLYGIEHFSREIQKIAGERFRALLGKLTENPLMGALLGAGLTSIIQSSTATTVIAVGLVNTGIISFMQSLGVMFGANVGTTVTAQLIALKLTSFAPVFILLGFVLDIFGGKYKFLGKPIFYFGFVFFSLMLISQALEPIKTDPEIVGLFASFSDVFTALLAGFLFTVIVQSSSVTTGLVVLLAGSGIITLAQGIPIIMGANIGTTATTLLVSWRMELHAKRAAVAHFLFNFLGVLIFLPFLGVFSQGVGDLGGDTAQQMANAHTIFNIACAIIFLAFIKEFAAVVERIVPGKQREILFRTKYLNDKLPKSTNKAFELITLELKHSLEITGEIFRESIHLIKNGDLVKFNRVEKLESVNDFLSRKVDGAIIDLSRRKLHVNGAKKTVLFVRISNLIEQLGDLGEDLGIVGKVQVEKGLVLSSGATEDLAHVYKKFEQNFKEIAHALPKIKTRERERIRNNDEELRDMINKYYEKHLKRLSSKKAYAGSVFVDALSVIESANAKLREIRKLCEIYP
ncbi:Na/Pi cotransporter family protein [Candidatus Micrarchaeota archaeon]|nr:Na/Pi cotransporter family protein [Candidatus Micrarchaeota archaeon]